jgi:uncharacterized protein YwgA
MPWSGLLKGEQMMFKWKKRYQQAAKLLATSIEHIAYVMTENKFLREKLEKLGVEEIFDENEKETLEFLGEKFKAINEYFETNVGSYLNKIKDD